MRLHARGAPQVRECPDRILRRTITPNRDTIRLKLSGSNGEVCALAQMKVAVTPNHGSRD